MGTAEDCSPAIAPANPLRVLYLPKPTSLSDESAPAIYTGNPPPSNPFNATWGAACNSAVLSELGLKMAMQAGVLSPNGHILNFPGDQMR